MRSLRQLVATDGNGLRVFLRFLRPSDLRPVATGCDRGAPKGLHPFESLSRQKGLAPAKGSLSRCGKRWALASVNVWGHGELLRAGFVLRSALSHPELIEQHKPLRVELIVPDALRDESDPLRVVRRNPEGLVDDGAIDPGPERPRRSRIVRLQRKRTFDLRVDAPVAELGEVQLTRVAGLERAAGEQKAEERRSCRIIRRPGGEAERQGFTRFADLG